MKKDGKIRGSTVYLITAIVTFLFLYIPIGIEFIAPFVGLFYYIKLKRLGRIKPFDWKEAGLIILYSILILAIGIYTQVLVLAQIPWWQLILIGIAADLYASTFGATPVIGDWTAAILAFIMAGIVAPGITGIILGLGMGIICILPGPTLGANTLYLILFKLVSLILVT